MKIITLTGITCIAALGSQAQHFAPKPFLEIIKENKLKPKLYQALPPLNNIEPDTITAEPAVLYAATDHMPVLMLRADASLYHMPVLKMLPTNSMPNGYPHIKPKQ